MNKEFRLRGEGVHWAIDRIKAVGIEQAEKEFDLRGMLSIPLAATNAEIARANEQIRGMVVKTVCALSCLVLHDEFGFGTDRVNRFIRRFNLKSEVLEGDFATWEDYNQILIDELGIDVDPTHDLRQLDKDLRDQKLIKEKNK